ncbi:MAG: T9SS type A sorting domain-containing protein [Chitinophagales bacterium]
MDDSGNAYITGVTDANGNQDIVTYKYSPSGVLLWSAIYNGIGNGVDQPVKIIYKNNKVYVAGYIQGSGTGLDWVTICYNAIGSGTQPINWIAIYNDPNNGDDKATDIEVDNGGNIYVSGTSYNNSSRMLDAYLIKYKGLDGSKIRTYHQSDFNYNLIPYEIAVNNTNNVFFTTCSKDYSYIYTLDTSFTQIGGRYFTSADVIKKLIPYGNYYFALLQFGYDASLDKIENGSPTATWYNQSLFSYPYYDYIVDFDIDASGNPYIAYFDTIYNSTSTSTYRFAKINGSTGDTIFTRIHNPTTSRDRPFKLSVGKQSTPVIYITGNSFVSGKTQNYTVGYNSNNGNALWTLNQSCSGSGNRSITEMKLDNYNNIYMVGTSNCSSTDDALAVKYCASLPVADAGADKPVCLGNSVQIGSASLPNYIYSWAPATGLNNANISNPLASPTTNTTYILTVTSPSGCSSKDTVNLTVVPAPVANAGADQSICSGSGVQIGISPVAGNTYSWSPTSGLSNSGISNPITNNTSTQTYTLTVTNTANCTSTDQVVVTIKPLPNTILSVSPSNTVCSGDAVTLTASGASSYVWSPAGSGTTQVINPSATVTYTITGTTNGCDKSATQTITVKPVPNVATLTQRNDTLFSSVTVAGASYKWYKNGTLVSTTAVPNYKITSTGNYTLTITNNGCSSTSAIFVVSRVTGIRNSSSLINRIDLYPNPASQSLYIHILSGRNMNVQIHVLDIGGKEVLMKDVQVMKGENYQSIDVSKYTKGMYLIQINDEEGSAVDKFLVE